MNDDSAASPAQGQPGAGSGAAAEAAEAAAQVRLEVEARVRAAVRILVIDNEVETADRVLERAGYEAEIATDGASGLSLAERFQPHLVILGSITNHVSGTEFARALRSSALESAPSGEDADAMVGSGLSVPILHIVDRARLLQQRLQTLGATPQSEAIFKPVDERELLDKVARALALKG